MCKNKKKIFELSYIDLNFVLPNYAKFLLQEPAEMMNIFNVTTESVVSTLHDDYFEGLGPDFIILTGVPVHANAGETVSDEDIYDETTWISES